MPRPALANSHARLQECAAWGLQLPSEANACPVDPNPPRAVPSDPDPDEVEVLDFELPDPELK
jgi:hypothetical protein